MRHLRVDDKHTHIKTSRLEHTRVHSELGLLLLLEGTVTWIRNQTDERR